MLEIVMLIFNFTKFFCNFISDPTNEGRATVFLVKMFFLRSLIFKHIPKVLKKFCSMILKYNNNFLKNCVVTHLIIYILAKIKVFFGKNHWNHCNIFSFLAHWMQFVSFNSKQRAGRWTKRFFAQICHYQCFLFGRHAVNK